MLEIEIKIMITAMIIGAVCSLHMTHTKINDPSYYRSDKYMIVPAIFGVCCLTIVISSLVFLWRTM